MKDFQKKALNDMSKTKSFAEREAAQQGTRTRATPATPEKDDMERTQLSNERARNPAQFDQAKQMYNSALQKQASDNRPAQVATPPMSARPAAPATPVTSVATPPISARPAAPATPVTSVATPPISARPAMPTARPMGAGMKKGGSVSSASKRADGIAQRGKTRGKFC